MVQIDEDFARFGAKSYAINKITSVEVRQARPHAMGCAVALALVAALFVLAYFGSLSDPGGGVIGVLLVGIGLGAAAWWQRKRAMIVDYQLFLITSAAETQAYVSRNLAEIESLRAQIEAAMSRHARGNFA